MRARTRHYRVKRAALASQVEGRQRLLRRQRRRWDHVIKMVGAGGVRRLTRLHRSNLWHPRPRRLYRRFVQLHLVELVEHRLGNLQWYRLLGITRQDGELLGLPRAGWVWLPNRFGSGRWSSRQPLPMAFVEELNRFLNWRKS